MKLILKFEPLKKVYTERPFSYLERSFSMIRIIGIWVKKYKLHLLLWMLFILYESVVIGLVYGVFGNPITYAAHYMVIIFLFYINTYVSLPWALKNNKRTFWRLPLVLISETAVFILISFIADKLLVISRILPDKPPLHLNFQYCMKTLYREIYFLGFSSGYYFLLTYIKEKRKTNELEKQRLKDIIYQQKAEQELTKAQNAFLKAQINPHFLFNTLDFVYHNIVSASPAAADAIIALADMMRYAIDSDKISDFISLEDEIEQVENLIYLSQIRKKHELNFSFQCGEEVRHIYLIPLVLLTLVENIFKHGDLSQIEHKASVNIYLKNDVFVIETDNLINSYITKTSHQTGLSNIKQRLKYAYGNDDIDFSFYVDQSNHFRVLLAIPIERLELAVELSAISKDIDKGLLRGYADLNKTDG